VFATVLAHMCQRQGDACVLLEARLSIHIVQELHLYPSSFGKFAEKIRVRNECTADRLTDLLLVENSLLVSCFMKGILMQIEIKFSILRCFTDFKILFL